MNFPPLVRWPLFTAIVFSSQAAVAQRPLPDGVERHPSDYQYPLRTWDQYPPDTRTNRGRVRDPRASRDRSNSCATLMRKLQSTVIPRMEFRRTTLADAVEFLRQESRRLDPDPNPKDRGVNIFLRPPKPSSEPGTDAGPVSTDPNVRITLTMERLPLLEALKYVASQAGMKVAVEPYAVSIVPQSYVIQNLVSDEYEVPPELLGQEADTVNLCSRVNLESWFEAKGVDFTPGASAIYLADKRKLIVRNTQENLDKIVAVISSALKPADPKPENP